MTLHLAAPRRTGQNSPAADTATAAAAAPRIVLIAAVAANGVIGADNQLPWRLPEDLKRFRALTLGHAVIMGRKTWESLPRALPGRQNIVVTRQRGYAAAGADAAPSFAAALDCVRLPEPVFCIGGGEIYRAALPFATTLQLTEIARAFDGDARFPPFERSDWREAAREVHAPDQPGGLAYAYVTYERDTAASPPPV
jgi:dihydrofolate reductase